MSTYVIGFNGERLDRIAKKTLQTELQGAVEAILGANPDLGDIAASGFVPGGAVIVIPTTFAPPAKASQVLAWE